MELLGKRPKAGLDISQTPPEGELGEGHARELVPRREAADAMVASEALDEPSNPVPSKAIHELSEHELSPVHPLLLVGVAAGYVTRTADSGR